MADCCSAHQSAASRLLSPPTPSAGHFLNRVPPGRPRPITTFPDTLGGAGFHCVPPAWHPNTSLPTGEPQPCPPNKVWVADLGVGVWVLGDLGVGVSWVVYLRPRGRSCSLGLLFLDPLDVSVLLNQFMLTTYGKFKLPLRKGTTWKSLRIVLPHLTLLFSLPLTIPHLPPPFLICSSLSPSAPSFSSLSCHHPPSFFEK